MESSRRAVEAVSKSSRDCGENYELNARRKDSDIVLSVISK